MHRRREQKYIHAVRNRSLASTSPQHTDLVRAVSENFVLAIGGAVNNSKHGVEGQLVEQDRSRHSQLLYIFESRGPIRLTQ